MRPGNIQPGDKVTYDPTNEKGIVRSITGPTAYVVYNCGEDWGNYQNYTAAATPLGSLTKGWPPDEDEE